MSRFTWSLRVYYEDTDLGGIVYYANYLRYMERARTEWLRALGCEQDALLAQAQALFVVVRASLEYKAPARFNDVLLVSVAVETVGRASVLVRQNVHRAPEDAPLGAVPAQWLARAPAGVHVCTGELRIACVHAGTLYPRPIPDPLYAELCREH